MSRIHPVMLSFLTLRKCFTAQGQSIESARNMMKNAEEHRRHGQYVEADCLYDDCLAQQIQFLSERRATSNVEVAATVLGKAEGLRAQGRYLEAEQLYRSATVVYRRSKLANQSTAGLARVSFGVGELMYSCGRYLEALQHHHKALDRRQERLDEIIRAGEAAGNRSIKAGAVVSSQKGASSQKLGSSQKVVSIIRKGSQKGDQEGDQEEDQEGQKGVDQGEEGAIDDNAGVVEGKEGDEGGNENVVQEPPPQPKELALFDLLEMKLEVALSMLAISRCHVALCVYSKATASSRQAGGLLEELVGMVESIVYVAALHATKGTRIEVMMCHITFHTTCEHRIYPLSHTLPDPPFNTFSNHPLNSLFTHLLITGTPISRTLGRRKAFHWSSGRSPRLPCTARRFLGTFHGSLRSLH